MVFVWIVSIVFFAHKEVRCANKTQNGLQYTNKKLSLTGDIISNELEI